MNARVAADAKAIADALLSEWADCCMAENHGKAPVCGAESCTFTVGTFNAAVRCAHLDPDDFREIVMGGQL